MSDADFPKIIWTLWLQGENEAPFIVKHCIDSWRRENPDWQVIVLDEKSMYEYVTIDLPPEKLKTMPKEKQANLIRLLLLQKHGGVWADATLYCMQPLDNWIYDAIVSGFFMFSNPTPDKLISNWMIVSKRNNALCGEIITRYTRFFTENTFKLDSRVRSALLLRFGRILNRSSSTTKYWFNPFFTKILRVYPYAIFHYIFERIVATDNVCKEIWEKTPKLSAIPPHNIQTAGELGMLSPIKESLQKEIEALEVPVYKLRWKYDTSADISGTALEYLIFERFESIESNKAAIE